MQIDLKALKFGAPAAERDIGQGLEDYFVESDAYHNVATGAKTVLLGNRGSGKSSYVKRIEGFKIGPYEAALKTQVTPNLRVVVSLRRELYDSIPSLYEDVKLKSGCR
jgi:hypothetical protein